MIKECLVDIIDFLRVVRGIGYLIFVLAFIGYGIWVWNKDRQKKQNSVEKADPPKDAK